MHASSRSTIRISFLGVLRNAAIAMATTEVVFLLGWSVLTLAGVRATPLLHHFAITALSALAEGMAMAGAFGFVAGLAIALTFNIGQPPVGPALAKRQTGAGDGPATRDARR